MLRRSTHGPRRLAGQVRIRRRKAHESSHSVAYHCTRRSPRTHEVHPLLPVRPDGTDRPIKGEAIKRDSRLGSKNERKKPGDPGGP